MQKCPPKNLNSWSKIILYLCYQFWQIVPSRGKIMQVIKNNLWIFWQCTFLWKIKYSSLSTLTDEISVDASLHHTRRWFFRNKVVTFMCPLKVPPINQNFHNFAPYCVDGLKLLKLKNIDGWLLCFSKYSTPLNTLYIT